MAANTTLALIDAALAEATQGTSTLITRAEHLDALLDLRNAVTDYAVVQELEADLRGYRRRRGFSGL